MNKEMMWSYLIHLGANMWLDGPNQKDDAALNDKVITDDEVWKKVVDFLPSQGINTLVIDIGEALQYESHPEISVKGAWSKEKMKAELNRIRSLGMTPIPKLNFSKCHDAWLGEYHYMVSTPTYYKVCEDLIKEIAEVFDYPELFHLGLDEEVTESQRNRKLTIIRNKELWWHDVNFFFNVCEKVGARPWVWADACWRNPEEYISKMSKSALQSNRYYGWFNSKAEPFKTEHAITSINTYTVLDKAGFEQVPNCSAYQLRYSADETIGNLKDTIHPDKLKGFMTSPWYYTIERYYYDLLLDASHFSYAKKKYYPE